MQVRGGLKAIYCSGWQVAGDANSAGDVYPDQSLYPANSVPELVRKLNKVRPALQRRYCINTLLVRKCNMVHSTLWCSRCYRCMHVLLGCMVSRQCMQQCIACSMCRLECGCGVFWLAIWSCFPAAALRLLPGFVSCTMLKIYGD
jgi:Isocitrate lyase family